MTESQRQPVPRVDTGEADTALAFLDFARTSVLKKTEGLGEDDLRRAMVPTGTSLLRLIRHLTDGERFWFEVHFRGVGNEPDWEAAADDTRPAAEIVAGYRDAIKSSNQIVRAAAGLDERSVGVVDGRTTTLRWTVAHMTSETARHAGHADIVRELLDGVTGR